VLPGPPQLELSTLTQPVDDLSVLFVHEQLQQELPELYQPNIPTSVPRGPIRSVVGQPQPQLLANLGPDPVLGLPAPPPASLLHHDHFLSSSRLVKKVNNW
jgi:hypothetical protein